MKTILLGALGLCISLVSYSQDEMATMPYIQGDLLMMVDHNENIEVIVDEFRNYNGIHTELSIDKAISKPSNIWLLHFNHNTIPHSEMLNALYTNEHVVIVQNNHIVTERATVPNDTNYGSLWYHDDGASDNDIDSELAWDITTGGQTANGDDIVVCVLEGSGAAWAHSDLIDNHWVNTGETPNNGIDDDGNGYTDDYDGWNLAGGGSDNIGAGAHGTGVSSMIGATGNNGSMVVGANWNVKIMQVDMSGSISNEANVIAAYTYPLVMRQMYTNSNGTEGAFVVATNASWGIDQGDPANAPLWCAFYDTLGYYGILNMGATTNQNLNVDMVGDLPTACGSDYMISVTMTNNNDAIAGSGYGQTTIDLAAPGSNVLMAYNSSGTQTASGTSFATPLTAGVAALMYSVPCSNLADLAMTDPQGAADIIRQALFDGTDAVSGLTTTTVTGGRLNSFNSCVIIQTDCGSYNTNCTGTFTGSEVAVTGCNGDCNGQINISASGGSGSYTYDIGNGPVSTSNFSGLCAGTHTVLVDDGVECSQNVSVTVTEPTAVNVTLNNSNISCVGELDGVIQMTGTGGTAPYTYSIDNGSTFQTSGTFPGLSAGTYNIVVMDNNNCTYNANVSIVEPSVLTTSFTTTDETMGNDGSINLTVSGGTWPYTYSWIGPNGYTSTTNDPNNLVAGVYSVTVTDANGCIISSGDIIVGSVVGINMNEIKFSVYPNPVDDLMMITLPDNNEVKLIMIDNSGKKVLEQKLVDNNSSVDVSELAAGVYLLKLTSVTGEISTIKMVIE
jgi:hypothetical protein